MTATLGADLQMFLCNSRSPGEAPETDIVSCDSSRTSLHPPKQNMHHQGGGGGGGGGNSSGGVTCAEKGKPCPNPPSAAKCRDGQ